MSEFIILTTEQANSVRGVSGGTGLNPIQRAGGVFILGVEVLTDPAHADHRDYLAALPVVSVGDPDFPAEIAPPGM